MVSQPWTRPQWHTTIDSTNARLLADPRPGSVVVAEHQSEGSGRRGRRWVAPPGMALAVSAAVRAPSPERAGWVPLLAGLAVARALSQHELALPTVLKWPNDVLVPAGVTAPDSPRVTSPRPGKVCGVLAHAAGPVVVVGAGLNIDQGVDDLPVPEATSWRLGLGLPSLPREVRQSWLASYLEALGGLLEQLSVDPSAAAAAYLRRCDTVGRRVRVELPGGGRSCGTVTGTTDEGALVLQTLTGTQVHRAGDVVHLRATAPVAGVGS
ncbi:MAG TPA: biotin--[acetyl-CoA-carboxylase] ligase [Ornithinimicrobium sp.]|uniref:biotin--[acetyl-CoA-carboxylase] ligase n=1 Tax=Ornithinimicrobium sp. TaxID=1977084 RepID=UPI002B484511|nr:biotin--[acetyl-CoA-carboxylase] ligase [Ornithinimicrobium sp.]HKJ12625.1 biotin--[acetyl-CoA-carboxylase] ligase [Ornithinimicrobium sp.]